jgi:uncharacterized coiled-coil DUF342 family protein
MKGKTEDLNQLGKRYGNVRVEISLINASLEDLSKRKSELMEEFSSLEKEIKDKAKDTSKEKSPRDVPTVGAWS